MFNLLFALLALAYPVIAFVGLSVGSPALVAAVLMAVLLARIFCFKKSLPAMNAKVAAGLVVLALGISIVTDSELGIRFYPVVINYALLGVFAASLFARMTVIERLARLRMPDLPESGVRYTRNVTKVWSVFFLLNGSVALLTALYADLETWTLYNGFIAYVLIGLVGGVEWLVRRRVTKSYGH